MESSYCDEWIALTGYRLPDRLSQMIRKIQKNELPNLLELYRHLHTDDPPLERTHEIEQLWEQIFSDPSLSYFVVEMNHQIVSTCTLTIIPNLTRGARPYGIIENVVTHPGYRCQGLGTKLLQSTLEYAWEQGCYKVMLMTSRRDESTLRFYQKTGFNSEEKTGFIAKPPC